MSLKCGIIGLPNVGKSTLFKALTKVKVPIENYAFCTIEPHTAIVKVPDPRLDQISKIIQPQKVTPTTIEFVDIAGLVKGAHKGEGLGNQFLSHIREAHALIHVLRCFEDPKITHVSNQVNPIEDMETIQTELILADLQSLENFMQKRKKHFKAKSLQETHQELTKEFLDQLIEHLSNGNPAKTFFNSSRKEDKENLNKIKAFNLLTLKPTLYLCNLKEKSQSLEKNKTEILFQNPYLEKIKEALKKQNVKILNLCASLESELSELSSEDQREFLKELNLKEPGLNRLIREAYSLLGLETFFTAGPKEVRAWEIKKGIKAPEAGGLIHSDFEKGFIRAEVFHFEDLFHYKDEKKIKAKGLYRSEGKDYRIKDGDIVLFRFNV